MKILNFCRINSIWICFFSSISVRADLLHSIPEFVHLHVSTERNWAGSVATLSPVASFAGFTVGDAGKFLTLANGPEYVNLKGAHAAGFTGNLSADRCVVSDAPIPMAFRLSDDKIDIYKLQTEQLNECVLFRIKDVAGLSPAEEQPACTVTQLSESEAIAKGGLCYFKISQNSSFTVQYELNPECMDENNFQRLSLKPLDIFAYSGYYISGDASGRSPSLRPLGSAVLRFSVEAKANDIDLSADMGPSSPRWPVQAFPDVHMGEMNIESKDGQSKLLSRVFFRNFCDDENESACRFSMPIGLQYTLTEIDHNGRTRTVDQWYSGGISPAFWEGFFPTQRNMRNFEFKVGGRYRLEADLTYLSIYYRLFKEGFKNFLIQNGLWKIDPNAPLLPIPPISRMPGLDTLRPNSPLPVVNPIFPGSDNDFQLELNQLRALLKGVDWPPYFERMCGEQFCQNAVKGDAKLKVGVEFTVDDLRDGIAKTKDYRVWRESSFASEYNINAENMMKAECQ